MRRYLGVILVFGMVWKATLWTQAVVLAYPEAYAGTRANRSGTEAFMLLSSALVEYVEPAGRTATRCWVPNSAALFAVVLS